MNDMTPPLNLWFDPGRCFMGGRWVPPTGGATLPIENPSTGETIAQLARGTAADIDAAVAAARAAYRGDWGKTPAFERGRMLMKLARWLPNGPDNLPGPKASIGAKPLKQAKTDAITL